MKLKMAILAGAAAVTGLHAAPVRAADWWESTSVSGRMFYDFSNIDATTHNALGVKQDLAVNGTGFDIKRFYIGIDHKFDDTFSANVTTDFQYSSTLAATELFIKTAYLQAKFDPALIVRVGAAPLPWIPFVEGVNGYRYLENLLVDRTKNGTTTDWGVHVMGDLAGRLISYQVSAVNGNGFKNPSRGNTVDFEGRINLNYDGFVAGIGGYDGKLGVAHGTATHHDATRFDALIGYTGYGLRLGAEYFTASDYKNSYVTAASTFSARTTGYSVFASYDLTPQWALIGRYDEANPKTNAPTSVKDNFYLAAIQYQPVKNVDFSLAYKHETVSGGNISVSEGTLGGSTFGPGLPGKGDYNEIGLFGFFQW